MYAEIVVKPTYIRDYEFKNRVQEERCIKIKANNQTLPGKHALRPDTETIEKRAIQSHWMPIENSLRTTTRNSPSESPILLRREIPMAWGTTTDSLTSKINPFQYAIEIKYLTLKDHTSYLIPDCWSRSPLSFPTSAWIDESLPQQ